MSMVSRYTPPGGWSQQSQRTGTDFTDQHGRKYYATIEIKSGDPCGLIEPQFTAPVMPPQRFLKRVPRRPYDVEIDYTEWKREIRTGWAEWQSNGRAVGMKLHGSAYDPTAEFEFDVLQIIGPAPTRIEPVLAAEQGNKWALGLSNRVDPRLIPFLEPEQVDPDYSDGPPEGDFADIYEALDDLQDAIAAELPPAPAKFERDAEVLVAFEAGASVPTLAKSYGIPPAHVRDILKRAMAGDSASV